MNSYFINPLHVPLGKWKMESRQSGRVIKIYGRRALPHTRKSMYHIPRFFAHTITRVNWWPKLQLSALAHPRGNRAHVTEKNIARKLHEWSHTMHFSTPRWNWKRGTIGIEGGSTLPSKDKRAENER